MWNGHNHDDGNDAAASLASAALALYSDASANAAAFAAAHSDDDDLHDHQHAMIPPPPPPPMEEDPWDMDVPSYQQQQQHHSYDGGRHHGQQEDESSDDDDDSDSSSSSSEDNVVRKEESSSSDDDDGDDSSSGSSSEGQLGGGANVNASLAASSSYDASPPHIHLHIHPPPRPPMEEEVVVRADVASPDSLAHYGGYPPQQPAAAPPIQPPAPPAMEESSDASSSSSPSPSPDASSSSPSSSPSSSSEDEAIGRLSHVRTTARKKKATEKAKAAAREKAAALALKKRKQQQKKQKVKVDEDLIVAQVVVEGEEEDVKPAAAEATAATVTGGTNEKSKKRKKPAAPRKKTSPKAKQATTGQQPKKKPAAKKAPSAAAGKKTAKKKEPPAKKGTKAKAAKPAAKKKAAAAATTPATKKKTTPAAKKRKGSAKKDGASSATPASAVAVMEVTADVTPSGEDGETPVAAEAEVVVEAEMDSLAVSSTPASTTKGKKKASSKKQTKKTPKSASSTGTKSSGGAASESGKKKKTTQKKVAGGSTGKKKGTTPESKADSVVSSAGPLAPAAPRPPAVLSVYPKPGRPRRPMTSTERTQIHAVMGQFCSLPIFCTEFTQPVSELHPELVPYYSKIVHHPMDLSTVCRRLEDSGYGHLSRIQLDMWRIFSNCVMFHTDARTVREGLAMPSFISIAMHLRDYFNNLWMEFLVPSEDPYVLRELLQPAGGDAKEKGKDKSGDDAAAKEGGGSGKKSRKKAPTKRLPPMTRNPRLSSVLPRSVFEKREKSRKTQLYATGATPLSRKCCQRALDSIDYFIENDGRVDLLDGAENDDVDGTDNGKLGAGDDVLRALGTGLFDSAELERLVVSKLQKIKNRLLAAKEAQEQFYQEEEEIDESGISEIRKKQVTVNDLYLSLKQIWVGEDVIAELRPTVGRSTDKLGAKVQLYRLESRLSRMLHKIVVPVYEAGSRGVNQSSIWGCMAAAIWARESSKRPYWPALVLGILAPVDQREDWHVALTERNEGRLPEKLRVGLAAGKKKAQQALRRKKDEEGSYFLIEFLGKHQFTWVREADIIENFDPDHDPNISNTPTPDKGSGKKRSLRQTNIQGSVDPAIFKDAVKECSWALEEFEIQVQDPCGDNSEDEEEEEDDDDGPRPSRYSYSRLAELGASNSAGISSKTKAGMESDGDEDAEELYAFDGILDLSVAGRKRAKQRAAVLKKKAQEAAKRAKIEQSKKDKAAAKKEALSKKKAAIAEAKAQAIEKKRVEAENRKRKREEEKQAAAAAKKRKRVRKPKPVKEPKIRRSKYYVPHKRERARKKVRAYLTNLANKGLLGSHGGPIATDRSDTSGLLAMALAFRAAAGEIKVSGLEGPSLISKPWEDVKVDDEPTSEGRCSLLKKQIELLEKAVSRLETEQERREHYIKEAALERVERIRLFDEAQAREAATRAGRTRGKGGAKGKSQGEVQKKTPDPTSSETSTTPQVLLKESPTEKGFSLGSEGEKNARGEAENGSVLSQENNVAPAEHAGSISPKREDGGSMSPSRSESEAVSSMVEVNEEDHVHDATLGKDTDPASEVEDHTFEDEIATEASDVEKDAGDDDEEEVEASVGEKDAGDDDDEEAEASVGDKGAGDDDEEEAEASVGEKDAGDDDEEEAEASVGDQNEEAAGEEEDQASVGDKDAGDDDEEEAEASIGSRNEGAAGEEEDDDDEEAVISTTGAGDDESDVETPAAVAENADSMSEGSTEDEADEVQW